MDSKKHVAHIILFKYNKLSGDSNLLDNMMYNRHTITNNRIDSYFDFIEEAKHDGFYLVNKHSKGVGNYWTKRVQDGSSIFITASGKALVVKKGHTYREDKAKWAMQIFDVNVIEVNSQDEFNYAFAMIKLPKKREYDELKNI